MYCQRTKKLRSQLLLLTTYNLSQHILQMMVQSTLPIFVLFIFFNLAIVYVFILF